MADQTNGTPEVKTKEVVEKELEDKKKSLDIGYVPWGVVSFEELDSAHEAMQKSWNMDTLVWQLHSLIDNIMISDTVENKQVLIANLMKEFAARTDGAMADTSSTKSTANKSPGVLNYLKSLFETEEPEPSSTNGMTFVKAADGTYRWVATYSNSFRDDDLYPEIISSKSHKRFVEMVDKGIYPLPELWLYHQKEWKWGQADVVAVDEIAEGIVMSIAAGHVDKGKEWVAEALMETGEILPVSHGMPVSEIVRELSDKSVIIEHQTIEISPLPHGKEANKLTSFYVLKENDMAINPKKREDMAKALGVEPETLLSLEGTNLQEAQGAVAQGTQAKAKADPVDPEEEGDPKDAKKEAGEGDAVPEMTMAEMAELLGSVVKSIVDGMTAMRTEINQLKELTVAGAEKSREAQVQTAASTIYDSIIKAATGTTAVDKSATPTKATDFDGPKQQPAPSYVKGGQIVPTFIAELASKSKNGHRAFNFGTTDRTGLAGEE